MRTPLERIRLGAIVLAAIVIVAVIVYRASGQYDWLSSLWMVVITISSVGFSEKSQLTDPWLKLFTIGVIVFGMSAAVYTIGGLIQMMTEGEVERALSQRRMTRGIERLENHVVVCGFGRSGQILADALHDRKEPFVVIDIDVDRIDEAKSLGYLCMSGDAEEEETLLTARVDHAKSLVTSLPNDAANVFITLTSRNLCESLHIIARAEHESTAKKLRQAGANKIVMPTIIGARQMVRMITRPSTADLIELMSEGGNLDVELDEVTIPDECELAGVSVRETEAHRRHRLLVVAVKQAEGQMVFNPDADYTFKCGDVVIIMGHNEDIGRFRQKYGL